MKTVEFKLNLNQAQEAKVNQWLNSLRWVWNKSLSLVEEFYRFKRWDKLSKTYVNCCPIGWEYRTEGKGDEQLYIPFSRIAADSREYCHCCFIREEYREQAIESSSYFSLTYYFAQKNHPDKPWFQAVPSHCVQGTIKTLTDAWEQCLKGNRRHPQYKGKSKPITTLINNSSKSVKVDGDVITLPKLGNTRVKTLAERWSDDVPISVLKICKRSSGYYLQLTGEVPVEKPLKASDKACGIDVGTVSLYTDDKGRQIKPKRYANKQASRMARLQRKIARQQKGSSNQRKSYQKLARLHEKTRLQRRAFNHKLSTKLVREYGAIAAENIQVANLTRRPKPQPTEDGKGYKQNGAKRKAGLNRSFADAGIGQLLTMTETKSKANGREFTRVPPHHTSQTCNACGHCEPDNRPTQSKFLCLKCRHTDHADVNAARNILERGLTVFFGSYRPWGRGVTPDKVATPLLAGDVPERDAESSTSKQMKQEAVTAAPMSELSHLTTKPLYLSGNDPPLKGIQLTLDLWENIS